MRSLGLIHRTILLADGKIYYGPPWRKENQNRRQILRDL